MAAGWAMSITACAAKGMYMPQNMIWIVWHVIKRKKCTLQPPQIFQGDITLKKWWLVKIAIRASNMVLFGTMPYILAKSSARSATPRPMSTATAAMSAKTTRVLPTFRTNVR
jgi:hypothetical protein